MKLTTNGMGKYAAMTNSLGNEKVKCYRQVNPLFRNSAFPAVVHSLLLVFGYVCAVLIDNQPVLPPPNLMLIVFFASAMCFAFGHGVRRLPQISEGAASCIRLFYVVCIALEFLYFGIPLFGSIPYNEFGWPIIHHIAVMGWVLILFGERYRRLDFIVVLTIAVMLFNRQLALFALLAYLMSSNYSFTRLVSYLFLVLSGLVFLGLMRNAVLGVDINTGSMLLNDNLFFILLYLMGPMYTTNRLDSSFWDNHLSLYWNTVPEWAFFTEVVGGYSSISFLIFYGFFCCLIFLLGHSKSPKLQVLGFLIYSYICFSFFSNVLISTPILANFLVILFFMLLLPKRAFR